MGLEFKTQIECVIPILRVSNLAASVEFYTKALSFKLDWTSPNSYQATDASVSRDNHAIMLTESAQGQPGAWLWIGVKDVDALHTQFLASGVKIVLTPTTFAWAREMRVEDPDGNILRLGSEPR